MSNGRQRREREAQERDSMSDDRAVCLPNTTLMRYTVKPSETPKCGKFGTDPWRSPDLELVSLDYLSASLLKWIDRLMSF